MGMPVGGAVAVASGIRAATLFAIHSRRGGLFLDAFFTIFWVVGITASFSILDHMDGLCAGIAAVAAAFFTIGVHERPDMVRTGRGRLGAALGFLRWNFNPAKIFMGDGGAMFLGS